MNKDTAFETLKALVAPYLPEDVKEGDIQPHSHFTNELNINSANLVDIILDVEDAFDIVLENEDMEAMQTMQNALDLIEKKQAAGRA